MLNMGKKYSFEMLNKIYNNGDRTTFPKKEVVDHLHTHFRTRSCAFTSNQLCVLYISAKINSGNDDYVSDECYADSEDEEDDDDDDDDDDDYSIDPIKMWGKDLDSVKSNKKRQGSDADRGETQSLLMQPAQLLSLLSPTTIPKTTSGSYLK